MFVCFLIFQGAKGLIMFNRCRCRPFRIHSVVHSSWEGLHNGAIALKGLLLKGKDYVWRLLPRIFCWRMAVEVFLRQELMWNIMRLRIRFAQCEEVIGQRRAPLRGFSGVGGLQKWDLQKSEPSTYISQIPTNGTDTQRLWPVSSWHTLGIYSHLYFIQSLLSMYQDMITNM